MGEGVSGGEGGWQPTPPSDYDADATAFVTLPEGLADTPLAAPGSGGYVPPQISVAPGAATDPAATGTFVIPGLAASPDADAASSEPVIGEAAVRWPEPNAAQPPPPTAGDTGQWSFTEGAAAPPSSNVTGQWSIPLAQGDLPDESGEFTRSALVDQWSANAPGTLPGGAPPPWAPPLDQAPRTDPYALPDGETHTSTPPPQAPGTGNDPHQGAAHPPGTDAHASVGPGQESGADGPYEGAARDQGTDAHAGVGSGQEPGVGDGPYEGAEHDLGVGGGPQEGAERERGVDVRQGGETETGPGDGQGAHGARGTDPQHAGDLGVDQRAGVDDPGADQRAGAAGPGVDPPQDLAHGFVDERPLVSYVLRVNGVDRPVTDAWIGESLLYVLRERLGLAGAKDGCSQGECGACAVQVDGRLVASCLVPAATAAGSEVRTVEGLAEGGQPSDVQRALACSGAVQCGFCVPGMAMTVHDLLEGNPAPSERETRQALCGNLCRCTGYRGVLDAVNEVVAQRGTATADTEDGNQHTEPPEEARIPHQAPPGAGGVAHPHPHPHPQAHPHPQPETPQDGGQA
ncbi:(2Fe-2S)-binding protein [Streptomyces sp. O3]